MSEPTIRDSKRYLLERLLAEEGLLGDATGGITPRADRTRAPLTHAQEVLWLLDRATPNLTAYNSAAAWRIRGPVDVAALTRALDDLVARHEPLRTRFATEGGQPAAVIDPPGPANLVVEPLAGHRPEDRLAHHARRHFDLERDHLFQPVLLQSDQESYLLLLTHHIVSDAWSYGVMTRELSALYQAVRDRRPAGLPAPAIQFGDVAAWERSELTGERLQAQLAYWRDTLLPAGPELVVPTDRPRPRSPSFEGGRALLTVPPATLDGLKSLAASEGATLYMVLLAGYQTLLYRWSGQDDVVTGSAIAGRSRSETEGLIGYFSGALPLRTRFQPNDTFRTLLARVKKTVLGALEHQQVPVEALVHELQAHGRAGHAPLFQAVLTMQDAVAATLTVPGLEVTPFEVETGTTKFELTLLPTERATGLELLLWYRSDLFEADTAERFLAELATLLAAAAERPDSALDRLPILSAAERNALAGWNATSTAFPSDSVVDLILAAAARRAHEPAVICGTERITWSELAARAGRLANHLQSLGVGPDVPVGLCFERSGELIAGMVGILAAGGAYVPLLPDQPAARLAQQLSESGCRLVVTLERHRSLLPAGTTVVSVDGDRAALDAASTAAPRCAAGPDHLAYVLFTSGSTGVPKGVAVTRGNLAHYTHAISRILGLPLDGGPAWHCGSVSTLAADLGHTSVFPALCSGGVLHLLPQATLMDAARFQAYVTAHPLDLLKITPSHFQALAGPDFAPDHLPRRWLALGGEPCPWGLADQVRSAGRCRVLNHYGPTETTVGACCFEVGSRDTTRWAPATVPIGRPLPNATTRVLDRNQEPAPIGVPGELWIGGAGVARGYLNRDDLTRERFIALDGERLYRTGDRVRRLPTGDLEFLGRLDLQVKVRGHRVELGEIEAVLGTHPAVRQAAVVLQDDRLVGYIAGGAGADDQALATFVGATLPDYMVPAAWVRLDALPLNANGKLDRSRLPALAAAAAPADDAPRTETERKLATAWAEVLKRDRIGIRENFFALGGHSLLAIRLLGRVAKIFGVKLPLRTLFEHPTVASLAEALVPTHPLEPALAAVWADVLKKDAVGRDDNFFALGGHSLLAIRLLGRVAKTFGPKLPLRVLFEHPTVASLAPVIAEAGRPS